MGPALARVSATYITIWMTFCCSAPRHQKVPPHRHVHSSGLGYSSIHFQAGGPSTCITFLEIIIDTVRFQLQLPEDKLIRIRTILSGWIGRRSGCRSNMESLFVRPPPPCGTTRSDISEVPFHIDGKDLQETSFRTSGPGSQGRPSVVALLLTKLAWRFIYRLRGTTLVRDPLRCIWVSWLWSIYLCVTMVSGASWAEVDISAKEMVPVVLAAAIWGSSWRGKCVFFVG